MLAPLPPAPVPGQPQRPQLSLEHLPVLAADLARELDYDIVRAMWEPIGWYLDQVGPDRLLPELAVELRDMVIARCSRAKAEARPADKPPARERLRLEPPAPFDGLARVTTVELTQAAALLAAELGYNGARAARFDAEWYREQLGGEMCTLAQATSLRKNTILLCALEGYERRRAAAHTPAASTPAATPPHRGVRDTLVREGWHYAGLLVLLFGLVFGGLLWAELADPAPTHPARPETYRPGSRHDLEFAPGFPGDRFADDGGAR